MKKRLRIVLFSGLALAILLILGANWAIRSAAKGRLYSDERKVPYNRTGLLLGTGKYLSDSSVNLYYAYRIQAAARLMRAGKIRYLVISGDNSRKDYNEPRMMKEDLMREGIDSARIFLDYAGFRTFDSMVRLKEVFGQDSVTVISQPFHNERAIYLASREGLYAIGFNARDVAGNSAFRVQVRERLARVKVFWDALFHTKPKFLGKKINLPE